ncbi:hypothetical protein KAJ27_21625 [bacterium]|nr:hypothetical protein [bacterium]
MATTNHIFYIISALVSMLLVIWLTRKPIFIFIEALVGKGFAKFATNITTLIFISVGVNAACGSSNSKYVPILEGIIKGLAKTLTGCVGYIITLTIFGFVFSFLYWLFTRFTKKTDVKEFFSKLDEANFDIEVPTVKVEVGEKSKNTTEDKTEKKEE